MTRRPVLLALAASALVITGCSAAPLPVTTPGPEPVRFAAAAPVVAAPDASLPLPERADDAWLGSTAEATGIPKRALAAYAGAVVISNLEDPGCAASWNLLAGIGWVESNHGTIFDGAVGSDGVVAPDVFGVPLDGAGVASIPDSDAGVIDGDATVDRAVGPMQLIPDTWRNWRVDGDGDGVENPHDLDDASLAAVHYLCRAGGDLAAPNGYATGILAWNRSEEYLVDVATTAERYGEAAAG